MEFEIFYAIPWLPIAIGGLAGLSGAGSWLGQKSANETNMALAKQGQKFELEMWNKNNVYNSPAAQMQRYKDAGLNPNLIYGSGSSSGLSSSYPRAHVATVQNELSNLSAAPLNALQSIMSLQLQQAQLNAVNNNADYTKQKQITEAVRARQLEMGITSADLNNQKMRALLPYATQAMEANLNLNRTRNKEILYRLDSLNPQILERMILENKDKKFNLDWMNNAMLENILAKNKDLNFKNTFINPLTRDTMKYNLTNLLPEVLKFKQLENSLKSLDLNINEEMNKYNMNSRDSWMMRLLSKVTDNNIFSKDHWLWGGDYDSKGKRVTKYRRDENSW